MIYETEKMDELAIEVKRYMQEHKLEDAYIESFRVAVPAGGRIPGIEEVLYNHRLRDQLTCFLMYRSSLLQGQGRTQGTFLTSELDSVGDVRIADILGERERIAWKLNDVMKEADFFHYIDAGYVKAGDNQSDSVRRIYRDIRDREKRQDIIDCLEAVLDKGKVETKRIRDVISSLENLADKILVRPGKLR